MRLGPASSALVAVRAQPEREGYYALWSAPRSIEWE
jgi:hypothetical protein